MSITEFCWCILAAMSVVAVFTCAIPAWKIRCLRSTIAGMRSERKRAFGPCPKCCLEKPSKPEPPPNRETRDGDPVARPVIDGTE